MDDNDNDIDLQLQPPWLSRSFGGTQQDAKLRTVERHVRRLDRHRPHPEPRLPVVESTPSALSSTGTSSSSSSNRSTSSSSSTRCMVVIPNARVWRKYWRLIRAMVVDEDAAAFVATAESTTNDTKSNNDNNTSWQWILTESAVECMDHRHQSLGEQTVGSERSALLRLVRDHCHQHHQPLPNTSLSSRRHSPFPRVMPMADLSMRNTTTTTTTNYDCWDCFGMQNWTIEEQSRHAQIRAATLVLEQHHQEQNHHPREDVEVCCCCWLLVDDDNDNDTRVLLPLPEVTTATNTIQYGTMADLLRAYSNISSSNSTPLLSRRMDPWYDLERLCAHEYRQRNPPAVHRDNTGEAGIRRSTTTSSSTSRDKEDARSDAFSYNNYSADNIALGLRHGRFIRGRLTVPLENVQEAYVTSSSSSTLTTTWFVPLEYRHGALHQDTVLVQVLPESQWCRPVGRRRLVFMAATTTTTSPMTEDEEEHKTPESKAIRDLSSSTNNSGTEAVPTARVVWVEQTHRRVFVATLVAPPDHNNAVSSVLVVPMDLRIPKIRIRTRSWRNWHGQRLKVQILTTSSSLSLDDEAPSKYPMGHCLEILGPIGDVEVEIQSLLIENQVDLEPFSVAALACLPTAGNEWRVSDKDLQDRRDLRTSRRIFSVDPPGCQDIDDTMHAEVLPNGDVEIGVHIADVTHFVEHNSQLDKEAQVRGTTFYLVDRRFDMLPTLLSSDLCSLHGGMDRLAVSAIWTFSSDLDQMKSSWFGRTVIRNCAAMTYQQADNILHNKPPEESRESLPPPLTAGSPVDRRMIPVLKTDLALLTRLARKRRKLREEVGGALDLTGDGDSGSELKFTIENGKPTKVVPKADKEIHHTIAELMILANTEVAKIIHKHFPDSALLRKHRSVEESSLEELRNVLTSVDVKLEGTDGASLAKALSIARQKSKEARKPFQSLLLSIATRSMTEAQYICTGDVEKGVDFSHYGLGLTEYTHFTSPIRRYCDVIVHKQLLASLANESVVRKSINFRPTVVRLKHLHHLPASEVVSVLAMNGLNNELGLNSSNDDIGDLAHDTSKLSLRNVPSNAEYLRSETAVDKRLKPYDRPEVMAICDGLNLHNRLAKRSSYECQSLFLSLYFKDHVDVTHAVVTHLRENGILVYVPKYDFKGPVYIRDTKGDIHLDPLLLGLPSTFGEPTSPDLNVVENCRRIPFGQCEWMDGIKNERLEVGVQGRKEKFVMRTFDVVHVSIACNNWDVRARVPVPRLQLVATPVVEDSIGSTKRSITTLRKAGDPREVSPSLPKKDSVDTNDDHECSVFDVLTSIRKLSRPNVAREAFCYEKTGTHSTGSSSVASAPTNQRQEVLKGRVVYGAFVNPDTRSAIQESLQSAAFAEAAQHRATLLESSRQTELEKTSESKRFERSITTRQQRLTSDKHHSRHTKG